MYKNGKISNYKRSTLLFQTESLKKGGSMSRNVLIIFLTVMFVMSGIIASDCSAFNPNPPASPVNLIFIHHSTGENWLDDDNGGLGIALRDNNYYVSDTNYGWGSDSIGDSTDIGHWWTWFRGPSSSTYVNELYNESGQGCSYSRLSTRPAGENEIIMFKSCFPNSDLAGDPSYPIPSIESNPLRGQDSGSEHHTISNAKGIYNDLLAYFSTRQDKLFVVITAPPLSYSGWANNARAFNQWLVREWLRDYPYRNVAVFDFFNVLTTNGGNPYVHDLDSAWGNHHRWRDGTIQHMTYGDDDSYPNNLEYPSEGDDHPSMAGNLKATAEFLPLLNIYYHCWQGTGACQQDLASSQILPDIKANYSDGPITLYTDSWLQLTASLDAGSGSGTNADWWVAADTTYGMYYYVYPDTWAYVTDISAILPAAQGPLSDISPVELINTTGLPVGTYAVYFGVDTIMNGVLDFGNLYFDLVLVYIVEE
jgi:hypothetical protein